MTVSPHFDQLLTEAAAQAEPQRLLFVFAAAELPDKPTPEQAARFAAGAGGALTPLMCVDKDPQEVGSFDALLAESRRAGPPWSVVFAAALGGREGRPPAKGEVQAALESMVAAVGVGSVGRFAAYAPSGDVLVFR